MMRESKRIAAKAWLQKRRRIRRSSEVFGRKSRRERVQEQVEDFAPVAGVIAVYETVQPVLERLLYDDELRDNIRTFIDSAHSIIDDLADEDLDDAIAKLWDDRKLRRQVETATEAIQQGSRRVRGQRVKGGGSFKLKFLLFAGIVGLIFFNPRTGPEARRMAREAYSSLTSEG